MGISQAQRMLQQLQQQLTSPAFAQQSMQGLAGAGLGAQNPSQFYSTPFDEQILRQSVLGSVLGRYYGNPQIGGVGNPYAIPGGIPTDPFTGGLGEMPRFMQAGFGDKASWKQAGKPIGGDFQMQPYFGAQGVGGMQLGGGLPMQGGAGGGFNPQNPMGFGVRQAPTGDFNPQMQGIEQGGFQIPSGASEQFNPQSSGNPFYDQMVNLIGGGAGNVPALNQDYSTQFSQALQRAMSNDGSFQGGGNPTFNFSGPLGSYFLPQRGFPSLDQTSAQSLNAITQGQLEQANLDFGNQRQSLLNDMFGRGLNQSTIAADAGGRLLYGRQAALNEIMGQAGQREMQARQALLDAQVQLAKSGGGGGISYGGGPSISFGGGGGGGMGDIQNLAMQLRMPQQAAPQDAMNFLQAASGGTSPIPLNFDQQMKLAQLQLSQRELAQQGALGFGGLGLQQQLGLGSQGLEGQQLQQQLLQFILGQGLARQQGAAGFTQSDLARMQQYLSGQQQLAGGIGQQSAQLEAQKKSFLSQLMGGLIGAGTAFFTGGASSPFSTIFH